MADDTRDDNPNPNTSTTPANAMSSEAPPKKYPKGVILGKDGKPCRSCNSFATFTQTSKSLHPPTSTSSTSSTPSPQSPPPDCPPTIETLGHSTWTLLHSISARYPRTPTPRDRQNITTFMSLLAQLYPCWTCAADFQAYMAANKVRAESRHEFGTWLCEAHNDVNRKLGKPEFDCARWEERWRTGWKDGRCG